jgi:hypothetical protein
MSIKLIAWLSPLVWAALVVWLYESRRKLVTAKILGWSGGLLWVAFMLGIYDTNLARNHVGHAVSCSERFPFTN